MLTLIIQRRNIVFFLKSRPFLHQMEARKKSEPQVEFEPIVIQLDALTIDHELLESRW